MMPEHSRTMSALQAGAIAVLALCLAACTTAPPAAAASGSSRVVSESAAIMAGEQALRDGDCRKASESFLAAARVSAEIDVARRAAQIALGCDQLETARVASARWRALDEWSGDAALAATLVALKRYDLDEARDALTAWRESGSAGSQDPMQFAAVLERETDATALYRVFTDVLVGEEPSSEVLLAQARLAFSSQNMQAAIEAALRAAELDGGMIETQVLVLRALSVMGEHNAAIGGAEALEGQLQGDDIFLVADLLTAAGREGAAERELLRLAASDETRGGAERRLIGMAIRNGDLERAEQRVRQLAADRSNTLLALLYFAEIAERRGDLASAVAAYRELSGTAVGLTARVAAARLMMKAGDRQSALTVLDDYVEQNPGSALDVGTTRAQLLAENGALKEALQGLDALREAYPDHPQLEYQRATVLETGGRTRDAVTQLEKALKARPDDPQLQNALGFTLADHNMRLPQAEQLIRKALAVSPDSAAIQDSLGWVLYRSGKTAEALPVLAQAWRNSGDGEIASHYGEVLWKSGDEGQARYVWQRALLADPEHDRVHETMLRLTGEDARAP